MLSEIDLMGFNLSNILFVVWSTANCMFYGKRICGEPSIAAVCHGFIGCHIPSCIIIMLSENPDPPPRVLPVLYANAPSVVIAATPFALAETAIMFSEI